MPASWMRRFARTSRWPMVADGTRNTAAMVAASSPSTVCKISGLRMAGSIAGCAQANIRRSRWSGMPPLAAASVTASSSRQQQAAGCGLARAPAAGHVDQPPARRGEQPGFRCQRHALRRPGGERRSEGVGQRVLGRRHVAAARGEPGDQLAIALPRRLLGRAMRRVADMAPGHVAPGHIAPGHIAPGHIAPGHIALGHIALGHIAQIGRTSMAPRCAPGQRAAQASAASRSGTSIR